MACGAWRPTGRNPGVIKVRQVKRAMSFRFTVSSLQDQFSELSSEDVVAQGLPFPRAVQLWLVLVVRPALQAHLRIRRRGVGRLVACSVCGRLRFLILGCADVSPNGVLVNSID